MKAKLLNSFFVSKFTSASYLFSFKIEKNLPFGLKSNELNNFKINFESGFNSNSFIYFFFFVGLLIRFLDSFRLKSIWFSSKY